MERIRKRLAEARTRLAEIYAAQESARSREHILLQEEEAAFEKTSTQLKQELEKKLERLNHETVEEKKRLQEKWRKRVARVTAVATRIKAAIEDEGQEQIEVLEDQQRETHVEKTHGNDAKVVAFKKDCADATARLSALESVLVALRQRVTSYMREFGVVLEAAEVAGTPQSPTEVAGTLQSPTEVAGTLQSPAEVTGTGESPLPLGTGQFEGIDKRLAECEAMLSDSQRKLRRLVPPVAGYPLVIAVFVLAGIFVHNAYQNPLYTGLVAFSLLGALGLAYRVYNSHKGDAHTAGVELMRHLAATGAMIERQKQLLAQKHEQGLTALDGERIQRICETYEKLEHQVREVNRVRAESLADLEARRSALAATMGQRRRDSMLSFENGTRQKAADLQALYDQRLADCNTRYATAKSTLTEDTHTQVERLAAEWSTLLAGLEAFRAEEQRRYSQQGWNESLALPSTFAEEVRVGDVRIELAQLNVRSDATGRFSIPESLASLSLPACVSFPLQGSVLFRASPYLRKRAIETLFGSVVRLLSSFPPAKAKLTIVDPIGLGQNFAALMHLADYDESLVNGRIWSDTVHIERKLTELTEHMEKVIQKYLRNRYATIADYNREAGELAEPYRFLVVADFPTGFSEVALERLAAIITSGVRCGVYTLILHDSRQKFPAPLDEAQLRRNGIAICESGSGLSLDEESLGRPVFSSEGPTSAAVDAVINAIGRQCREAARVQVPFDVVCPKPDQYWSLASEPGIRVPLGKTGADRLQFLDLGKGTAQHALVAGKTGSGKSNMVHVIITSAALWYSPREVEFYLIDFKKGVEFKTYATNRLPHVRVVAIESDREFGLSVLRRIDKELTRRGELFRKFRVQDFADYRKAAPQSSEFRVQSSEFKDAKPLTRNPEPGTLNLQGPERLPRTLLIIDEFQEFFTDDDEVAQDAALLLDRIVRQGRAFGIHVILGSQTLGGTYSLAKSTLGQMAVRIALQCSEADSYLILSDDNAAAALLSRPGEAIYNDMSGLVEGNNPFQAVFLPRDSQEPFLRSLRQKSVEEGMESVGSVAVFEGNSLSDLRNNPLLREAAMAGRASLPVGADGAERVWLGEANAIKGPTEVEFARQAGSNLLVIGHRGGSDVAMCCATVMSLAAASDPRNVHIRVLDGTAPDSGARERLLAVKKALPCDMEVIDVRQAAKAIEDLSAIIKSRQENGNGEDGENDGPTLDKGVGGSAGKHYLLVLGLEKFRLLRQDSDFEYSAGGSDAVSPAKSFSDILVEGPTFGVHTVVWCDTLGNLNRTFGRKTLREFESRVLFQMSATDSSELIDSPAANRLGLYNALLYSVQTGGVEKFRPYALPDIDLVEELGRNLNARLRLAQSDATARRGSR